MRWRRKIYMRPAVLCGALLLLALSMGLYALLVRKIEADTQFIITFGVSLFLPILLFFVLVRLKRLREEYYGGNHNQQQPS